MSPTASSEGRCGLRMGYTGGREALVQGQGREGGDPSSLACWIGASKRPECVSSAVQAGYWPVAVAFSRLYFKEKVCVKVGQTCPAWAASAPFPQMQVTVKTSVPAFVEDGEGVTSGKSPFSM